MGEFVLHVLCSSVYLLEVWLPSWQAQHCKPSNTHLSNTRPTTRTHASPNRTCLSTSAGTVLQPSNPHPPQALHPGLHSRTGRYRRVHQGMIWLVALLVGLQDCPLLNFLPLLATSNLRNLQPAPKPSPWSTMRHSSTTIIIRTTPQVPRPDGKADYLGLKVLDEPANIQSDAGLLALQLRQLGRGAPGGALDVVGHVEHGSDQGQRARAINTWIASVAGVLCIGWGCHIFLGAHRKVHPPNFQSQQTTLCRHPQEASSSQGELHLPAALHRGADAGAARRGGGGTAGRAAAWRRLGEWNGYLGLRGDAGGGKHLCMWESKLALLPSRMNRSTALTGQTCPFALPFHVQDLDLVSYARMVCAVLDVPVAAGRGGSEEEGGAAADRSVLEALHLLFTLLLEFQANPYLRQAVGEPGVLRTG